MNHPLDRLVMRDVDDGDLPIFFEHQSGTAANPMAAFTSQDPADRKSFMLHWNRIRTDPTVQVKTILFDGQVAGSVLVYEEQAGKPEVSYWIGKEYWGQGIATRGLAIFLTLLPTRPLYARAARDNIASIRVLEKCGFKIDGYNRGFANARGEEIEEVIFKIK